jgi:APA family basic amino acid/polyamine antiporter
MENISTSSVGVINEPNLKKQIGFLAALMISIGSSIGAGILFKNIGVLRNTNSNITLAILSWVIAGLGTILMGFALTVMVSSQRGNKGVIGWAQDYTHNYFYKFTKSFMLFIYYPIILMALPIFIAQFIEKAAAGSFSFEWWSLFLFVASFIIVFMTLNYLSLRVAAWVNTVITFVKFIPIIVVVIIGFIYSKGSVDASGAEGLSASKGLIGYTPFFGVIGSIPGIFFAYDGFYSSTSLKASMKNSNKLGLVIVLALSIITFTYIIVSISIFNSTSSGSVEGIAAPSWLIRSITALLTIAIFGVFNGYSIGTHRTYREFINESKENKFGKFLSKKKFIWKHIAPISVVSLSLIFLLFTTFFGGFLYNFIADSGSNSKVSIKGNIYDFTDLLTNWISLIIFIIISTIILVHVIKKIKLTKNNKTKLARIDKWLIVMSILTVILVYIPGIFMVVNSFVNISGFNGANSRAALIESITLVLTILLSLVPVFFAMVKKTAKKDEAIK